jgi:hypothetical protein
MSGQKQKPASFFRKVQEPAINVGDYQAHSPAGCHRGFDGPGQCVSQERLQTAKPPRLFEREPPFTDPAPKINERLDQRFLGSNHIQAAWSSL